MSEKLGVNVLAISENCTKKKFKRKQYGITII